MGLRIAFIGAGSIEFTRKLVSDLLTVPQFSDAEIRLMDIDKGNLERVSGLISRDLAANKKDRVRLSNTLSQKEAVTGASYVMSVARIGGLEAFRHDVEIPLRYGVDQCVGDTICAGGIMYGQRTIPFILELCRDIRELGAPGAMLLNYVNPMAMNTWAANQYGGVRTIGLCHGVQHGHGLIARALGLPKAEVEIVCAGINHQTWYIKVLHKGQDMTGRLLEAFERDPEMSRQEKVRIDMIRRFGYFSTESNGHLSEYLPWYRKRREEIEGWIDHSEWIHGETGGYLHHCEDQRLRFDTDYEEWKKGPARKYEPAERSEEHGSFIIEALETGRRYRGHFNTVNQGCITNLPPDAVIEAPGYVDATGLWMPVIGDLPLGPAAVCNASISVQRLAVQAAVRGDDLLLRQAMMMDPLVGAVCTPAEIWQMVDEMLVAESAWLPQYARPIVEARRRIKQPA
jgi:alpha-galactosidase/6-phospho-beta-glucosidase family protein